MIWKHHKYKKVDHYFHEKPYIKGWSKALCGYVTYSDMLVEYGINKVCKKCDIAFNKAKEATHEPK
jgi:hypothetical protein